MRAEDLVETYSLMHREGGARGRVTKTKTAGGKTPGEEEDLEHRYAVRAEDLVETYSLMPDARSRSRVY